MKCNSHENQTEIPIIDIHSLLNEAGVILPPNALVIGDVRSNEGARIEAETIRVRKDVELLRDGCEILMKMKDNITGKWACKCERGSGTCDLLSAEDIEGNPTLGCVSDGCSGDCKLYVQVDSEVFNRLAVMTLGVELPDEIPVSGDITSDRGYFIASNKLKIQDKFASSFVEWSGYVLAIRNNIIRGTFGCGCSSNNGECGIEISGQLIICKPGRGCKGCSMKINIPKIALKVA
jgi:hypothetical protein